MWRLLSIASLLALAVALLVLGWDRGPDIVIDFGRELYVPWRLVEGEHLHTDIAWFNGPLGPWMIEGWTRVFGVSLDALQALNALGILVTLGFLVTLVREFADGLCAWAAGVVFLAVFAVAQQESCGNFLFLAPYSHGITFGFLFGVGCLWALARAVRDPVRWAPLVAGVCCGLAFLTKVELSLAVWSTAALGLVAACSAHATLGRRRLLVGLFALGALLPIAAAYARFAHQIGLGGALHAVAGTWPHAFDGRVNDLDFYRNMRGMDDPAAHLVQIARQLVGTAAIVAVLMAVAIQVATRFESRRVAAAANLLLVGALSIAVLALVQLKTLLILLPVVLAGAVVLSCWRWLRERNAHDPGPAFAQLLFVVFAAGLLPKILLQVYARHYGFVLSVPGALVLVVILVKWLPAALVRRSKPGAGKVTALRAAGLAIVLAFTAANLHATRNQFLRKGFPVGEGSDRILTEAWRGTIFSALVRELDARLDPGDTLLVLPEGIMLNYLLRTPTPTPIVNFMPPEMIIFGEERILAALAANPPDVVAIVHRPTDVYGYPYFGQGYGESVLAWVRERYEDVLSIGGDPFEDGASGAVVMLPRARAPR